MTTTRRYDIDWLRVIAIGLLLIYHIAIVFQPWGALIRFIQSDQLLQGLWLPMSLLNVWRIPLLFYVSGMGVAFAMRKRNWLQLIMERIRRILIPFLFGIIAIVPLHMLIWQKYYNQELSYAVQQGHLWFLANIFLYVLLLTPLFFYLKNKHNSKFVRNLNKVIGHPLGILLVAGVFVLEAMLLNPEVYEMYALNWHGFVLGMLAFFFGFYFVQSGEGFWQTVLKWRWGYLFTALLLYLIRWKVFYLKSPNYLVAVESVVWVYAVFGFSFRYLNRSGKILSYLSQGAYPIYIIHMILLYLGSAIIMPLSISASMKFVCIVIFTSAGCFGIYEFLIRRLQFLRPLFGLKKLKNKISEN